MRAQLGETRIGAQRIDVARPAERQVEHFLDAAGARAHHGDAVAEQDRLVDRVGDEHHGLALVLHDAQQLLLQHLAGLRVERGERLVHQHDVRIDRERAHQADALLHAAGELVGIVPLETVQADQIEIVPDALLDARSRRMRHREAERRVVMHGLPRQQAEMLEHHRDALRRAGDGLAADQQLAAGDLGQSGDAAQEGGLAAAARADHAQDLLRANREIERAERHHGAVEEQLAGVARDDRVHHFRPSVGNP